MPITKDVFVRGYQFDGATGLHSGEQLEDLVTKATPADGSEMVDQVTLETYLDEVLNVYRLRVKDGSITEAKIADGAITNAKLAEGFTMVKSVQRANGTIAASTTTSVTITSVDWNKALLIFNCSAEGYVFITKVDATHIQIQNTNTSATHSFSWQVIEYV